MTHQEHVVAQMMNGRHRRPPVGRSRRRRLTGPTGVRMASASGTNKRDAIELSDDDEPPSAPKASKTLLNPEAASFQPTARIPKGSSNLRGVSVPAGWSVQGSSLLVWEYRPAGSPAPTGNATIACFDFDGCLANTPLGGNDPKAWTMQYPHVPLVLRSLAESGHRIVIVTNESMDRLKKPEAIKACILKKTGRLEAFAAAVGVPLVVLCPTAKDAYRKPGTAAWEFFCGQCNSGVAVDLPASFFVGDAAGRTGDHSDCDLMFAQNCGLPFYNEKTFFESKHPPR